MLCDYQHDLVVDLGWCRGLIPRPGRNRSRGWEMRETEIWSMGIREGMPQPMSTKQPRPHRRGGHAMSVYLPEGLLLDTPENIRRTGSAAGLAQAMAQETILEGRAVLCDYQHDLVVDLGWIYSGTRHPIPRCTGTPAGPPGPPVPP